VWSTSKTGEECNKWAQGANAWCQIGVNLGKIYGGRVRFSSVGHKYLFEIHPEQGIANKVWIVPENIEAFSLKYK
jgi:hypothetical protein